MDTYSVDIITILNLLVVGGAMIFIAASHRQAPGFASVGVGLVLAGLGLVVVVMRLLIPGKAIILLSDVVLFAAALYLTNGLRTFCDLTPLRPPLALPAFAVLGAGIVFWLYIRDEQAMRIALVSLLYASVTAAGGFAASHKAVKEDRAVYGLTAAALFLNATFLAVRMAHALGRPVLSGLMGEGPIETAHLITLNVGVIVSGFGLLTASNLRLKREVEASALYDPLTQLPNRRFFEERLSQAGRRASRTGGRLALIYVDVDGFKQLNDSFGHKAGDAALRAVAARLSAGSRESDCVARLGGDEFAVLVEDAPSRPELSDTIDRLKRQVAGDLEIAGCTRRLSISCGFSVFPDDVDAVGHLVDEADQAMYAAKKSRPRG